MKAITFTKKDIAKQIAERMDTSVQNSTRYLDEMFTVIREMLCEDEPYIRIEIRNFGVFESKPTKAKPRARNPRTNEEIYVPAHKKTHFKPGKILKSFLNKPLSGL